MINKFEMHKVHLLIVFMSILIKPAVFSQKIIPFNYETKFGIRNKNTGKILIPAKYNKIISYNDSVIIVLSRDFRYGAIDTLDNVLVDFSNEQLYFNTYDPYHLGQIIEFSNYTDNPNYSGSYFVDKNRNCIPYDYYPCPAWKKTALDSSIVKTYLQNVIKSQFTDQIDSSFFWIEKAIKLEPKNPFLSFQKAELFLKNKEGYWLKHLDTLNVKSKEMIDSCLKTALQFEKRPVYIARILNVQNYYYKHCIEKKERLKESDQIARNYDFSKHYDGLFFFAGISYNKGVEIETGLGAGLFSPGVKHSLSPYTANSLLFLGGSWLKNVPSNIDGYRIYLISFLKPLRFGLSPIFYTNYSKSEFMVRPEFGFGFNFFVVSAGYNIRISGNKFSELNTFNLGLKYYLPISTDKSFMVQ